MEEGSRRQGDGVGLPVRREAEIANDDLEV
jgi:hypothetical protein